MEIKYGAGTTKYSPGVEIKLTGAEVAGAIDTYLVTHNVVVRGARTITVNSELCQSGRVYVDPSGFVIYAGEKFDGRGPNALHNLQYIPADVNLNDKLWLIQQIERLSNNGG